MDNAQMAQAWRDVFEAAYREVRSGGAMEVTQMDDNGATRMNPAIQAMKQASAEIRALDGKQDNTQQKSAEVTPLDVIIGRRAAKRAAGA